MDNIRDFDAARTAREELERGFTIKGEKFRIRPGVHPSVLIDYEASEVAGQADLIEAYVGCINAFMWDDGERKRFAKLLEQKENPVSRGDLKGIMAYLYEVEGEVPTIAPASSSASARRASRTSEAATSSPGETGT